MAKRYYIIPMGFGATDVERHLAQFSQYGVGMLDIFASVWRAIIDDDMRYHLDIANYISRAVKQQWHDNRLVVVGSDIVMQNEIDEMTRLCIEVCDSICEHVRRFMDIIQSVEIRETVQDTSYWGIHGLDGNDVIVYCEDPTENDQIPPYFRSTTTDPIQLR